jgi:hypothetical protein
VPLLLLALITSLLLAAPAAAAVDVYVSTGSGSSIESNPKDHNELRNAVPVVNQPANEVGWINTGRREVTWEDETTPVVSLDLLASPGGLPGDYFNRVVRAGLHLSTPGTGFTVSQDDDTGTDADPDLERFDDVRTDYAFSSWVGQRLFAPLGSRIVDVSFFKPGTDVPATVSLFGAIVSGVDRDPSTTSAQAFDEQGNALGAAQSVPRKTTAGLSFIGFRTTAGERIARVRLTLGDAPLGAVEPAQDVVVLDDVFYDEPWRTMPSLSLATASFTGGESQGAATVTVRRAGTSEGTATVGYFADEGPAKEPEDYGAVNGTLTFAPGELTKTFTIPIVADALTEGDETLTVTLTNAKGGAVISPASASVTIADAVSVPATPSKSTSATPITPVTPTPADRTAPRLALTGIPAKLKLAAFKKGVTVRVSANEAFSLEADLRGTARKATISAVGDLILGERDLPLGTGNRSVTLKPSAKLLKGVRRLTARLVLRATDAAGNRTVESRKITIR